jgi:hypothetical protein
MTDTETKGTDYVVFQHSSSEEGQILTDVGKATAVNDIKAIKAVAGDNPSATAYVAIPVRNLKVRNVTVRSEPKVVIS